MKKIIRAKERYFADMWKIKSYFLFSFADYYDPNNMNWWALRVFNDDFIAWETWFPTHPHKHFEIITIMLSGTITHRDSLGNSEKIHAWEIQVTNTGSGITHSEFNEEKEDIKLFQIWFSPLETVPVPNYYTTKIDESLFKNTLFILASGIEKEKTNSLISPVSVKRWNFDTWKVFIYKINEEIKYILLYVISWSVNIGEDTLQKKDQLRIYDEKEILLEFLEESQIIVIESK